MNEPVKVNEGKQHVLSPKKYSSSRKRLMDIVMRENNLNN